ncbi:FeoC-like transcriptional regulator [Acidithiobacillus sp. YTS05]|nr:FeoC-like transcriptional regulator [Acidithiobacillus sp. YTS05]
MMQSPLFRIRDLLRDGESLSAAEIAQRLDLPQDLVDAGLQHWQRRGMITRVQTLVQAQVSGSSCQSACAGACAACVRPQLPASVGTRYRWRARATAA